MRRIRYGAKNEALPCLQTDLFEEACNEDLAAIEAEVEKLEQQPAAAPKPKRPRAGRQPLPDHLPRIEHRHEPESCDCGKCGKTLVLIGEDVTEQLDVKPAEFFVHRHIRPQYACRDCDTITAAPIPPAIIDGGMAAVGLLTWVVISKFVDHLPLYRLEQIAARDHVILSRSTLGEWVGRIGIALQPLVDRLQFLLLRRGTLHADETPVAQLDPGRGETKKAYLRAYRSNDPEDGPKIIVFDYRTERSGDYARQFPGDWQGHLMVDDYGAHGGSSAKAIDYALRRRPALIRYAETGHLPIDNNPVENIIRPIAIGKNYAQFVIMQSKYRKLTARLAFHAADFA